MSNLLLNNEIFYLYYEKGYEPKVDKAGERE